MYISILPPLHMHNFLSRCSNKTHNVFVQCTMYIAPIIQGDAKATAK